jgi:hypothetical protein
VSPNYLSPNRLFKKRFCRVFEPPCPCYETPENAITIFDGIVYPKNEVSGYFFLGLWEMYVTFVIFVLFPRPSLPLEILGEEA